MSNLTEDEIENKITNSFAVAKSKIRTAAELDLSDEEIDRLIEKDILKRDKRANAPSTIIDYDPADIKQTIRIMQAFRAMSQAGKALTPETIQDRFDEYIQYCSEIGFKPTIESLCVALGINRITLRSWKNGGSGTKHDKEKQNVAQQIYEMFAAIDADLAMNNKVYPATYIFRGKNYYDMRDETEVVVTPNNPLGDTVSAEEIAEKYAELPDN